MRRATSSALARNALVMGTNPFVAEAIAVDEGDRDLPPRPHDPLTDVADIGVSSFSEACATHHEDEGAKEDDDSIVEKSKNEAITESPSLGFPVESKSNNDPEDALSPYDDEVDYEPTPSPPEALENNDMDVPLDENVGIRLDRGTGDSQSEIPIVAKSFLIDRIMDTMKTFNRRKFRSAREEVSKYCQCLFSLGIDIFELERQSSPNFISAVRLMNADENMALRKRKLASHISTKSSLLQATGSVSLELQQTREKIKELEESILHLKSTEAELTLRLEVADDSLKKLIPTEEELQKDVVDAEKEYAAAIEGCNDSKESTGLRELIELFEERRQIFEI
uniref:Uncharacterized protein n=1 Tax=Ananas comosus var. bracteatus TaxID=296719 RepID=A0A6V7NT53_ANACO|nr:unnamed protein product [Ananas comosus var. bracteatus]